MGLGWTKNWAEHDSEIKRTVPKRDSDPLRAVQWNRIGRESHISAPSSSCFSGTRVAERCAIVLSEPPPGISSFLAE